MASVFSDLIDIKVFYGFRTVKDIFEPLLGLEIPGGSLPFRNVSIHHFRIYKRSGEFRHIGGIGALILDHVFAELSVTYIGYGSRNRDDRDTDDQYQLCSE